MAGLRPWPTTYEYDEHKRHNKIIHPDGQFMQITYNLNDFITSITDENGHIYQYLYDQNDNPIKIIEPTGDETRFAYDLMDRVSHVTDKLGNVSTFSYDSMGGGCLFYNRS